MSLDDALRAAVLAQVPELVAALREELGRSKLIPIKEAIVSYRAILAAEKRCELKVYRVGNGSFVDEIELYDWIKRVGAQPAARADEHPADEIAELIDMQDGKRRKGRGRAA